MSDNGKRIGWAAVMVFAGLMILDNPPPSWFVYTILFAVSMFNYLDYRDRVRRRKEER